MTHLLFFFACSGATDVKDTSVDTGIVEPSTEPSTEPSGEPVTEPSSETSTDASVVVFNELLAKSDLTEDWIELYNASVDARKSRNSAKHRQNLAETSRKPQN